MNNYSEKFITDLVEKAKNLRLKTLDMIYKREAGHPGGSLSVAEIITSLYFSKLNVDPKKPDLECRDRFILSKGHASAALYYALAVRGFFPESDLDRWGDIDCHLQGHPDRNKTNGVDCNTGTLGHGISIAVGLLLSAILRCIDYRVYVLLGDGECQSGVIWEGAMAASKFKLDKLVAILDYNGVQLDGKIDEIMPIEPIIDKWKSFNWEVIMIDGHNIRQILEALDEADNTHGKPTIIIAKTVKGKGVSFMENKCSWHGTAPDEKQFKKACMELGK
jgi:transketolase